MLIALLEVLGVDLIVLVFLIAFAAPGLISHQKVLEMPALCGPTGAC